MRAFIFPGQGSQSVGMGKALAEASAVARELFQEVDEALGQNLARLMAEGPQDALTLTENAQPAIMANALATLRVLEREAGLKLADKAQFVAGHSLGEYTALAAADALDVATTARLLKLRGQAMQAAVPVGEGAMAALLGASLEVAQAVAEAAAEGEVCTIANDNDPTQVVISGHKAAVERALGIAKEKGAKRALLLPVSAPFHSPLMAPAARAMEEALAQEVGSRGITVNCIAPGFIRSAMTDALPDAQKEALLGRIPAGDLGEGNDVAAAAVYLASREAGYVTGQTLHVNGGMAMI